MKSFNMRKLSLTLSMLLFPITLYYFSPALIIQAGLEGIINGSFLVFLTLFLSAIFLGRLFCAYLCPAGGLQECLFSVNDKRTKPGRKYYIKYALWFVWMILLTLCYIFGKGVNSVDFFYETKQGISVIDRESYILYYAIILFILLPPLLGGRRSFCHYFCWMAPFMVLGIKVRKILGLPGLQILAQENKCISCKICSKNCPMSIDVLSKVKTTVISDSECIHCGECVRRCPKNVLSFKIQKDKVYHGK